MRRRKLPETPEYFKSIKSLSRYIKTAELGKIDSREWKEEWSEAWVVYADLVAFAARAMRSDTSEIFRRHLCYFY